MKKIFLALALATTLVSCSNDDTTSAIAEDNNCKCDKYYRYQKTSVGPTGWTTGPWYTSTIQFNYSQDCNQDGKFWTDKTTTNTAGTVKTEWGYIIKCTQND
jgi:hypothetical protein